MSPPLSNIIVLEAEGEQTEEHREAEKKETRVQLTRWGKDHIQFGNSKLTLCDQRLPIYYRKGRGGPLCAQCRRALLGKPSPRAPRLIRYLRLVKKGMSLERAYDQACLPGG